MRVKINLDTMTAINDFVKAVTIYSMEWGEVWCESDDDIYHILSRFIAEE